MAEKILIVDDDVDSLKLIGIMLQRHGYEVAAVNSGRQALAKADAEIPDLIILDVMMPDMNGLDVCRRLRENPKTAHIPIIMFTAKTLIDDKVKGFEAGADDYLTKPTHPAELASRIKAVLLRNAEKAQTSNKNVSTPISHQQASHVGRVIGLIGVKGGVGTTTLGINLAASYMSQKRQTLFTDIRLGEGHASVYLGMDRTQGVARLLSQPIHDITPSAIQNEIVQHQSGLQAILSTIRPRESQLIPSPDVLLSYISGIRAISDLSIIDLGPAYSKPIAAVLKNVDQFIYVIESTTAAIAIANEHIREIQNDGIANKMRFVIINRAMSTQQVAWQEIESILRVQVSAIISPALDLAYQAMDSKTAMVLMQPNAMVSTQIVRLSEEILS
ncbi:response regulator [Anaerolineales bacterium]